MSKKIERHVVMELLCPSSVEFPCFDKEELTTLLNDICTDLSGIVNNFTMSYKPTQPGVFCYTKKTELADTDKEHPTIIAHMYTNFRDSVTSINACHDSIKKNLMECVKRKFAASKHPLPDIFILEYSLNA